MLHLDARLAAAAALVEPGARVADVGCDHGRLAVYLAQSGRAARVIATDVRPQPLAKAKELVQKTGCGPLVECRLADGLSCVLPGEVDTVIIAGMSGITIAEILAAAPWTAAAGVRIIAVPANKPAVLRRFLAAQGFEIECEQAVQVGGYPYGVLAARWSGRIWQPGEVWCQLGLLADAAGPDAAAYRAKVLQQLRRQAGGLAAAEDAAAHAEAAALRQCISEVEKLCSQ